MCISTCIAHPCNTCIHNDTSILLSTISRFHGMEFVPEQPAVQDTHTYIHKQTKAVHVCGLLSIGVCQSVVSWAGHSIFYYQHIWLDVQFSTVHALPVPWTGNPVAIATPCYSSAAIFSINLKQKAKFENNFSVLNIFIRQHFWHYSFSFHVSPEKYSVGK